MVRAGEGASMVEQCIEGGYIGVGFGRYIFAAMPAKTRREDLAAAFRAVHPDWSENKLANSVGQLYRFLVEVKTGDEVVTGDPARRLYYLGTVESEAEFVANAVDVLPFRRRVKWARKALRDELSVETRNLDLPVERGRVGSGVQTGARGREPGGDLADLRRAFRALLLEVGEQLLVQTSVSSQGVDELFGQSVGRSTFEQVPRQPGIFVVNKATQLVGREHAQEELDELLVCRRSLAHCFSRRPGGGRTGWPWLPSWSWPC
jgi:hypothetical protein